MRVVIDSNVWISALVFGGNPRKVFKSIIDNGWTIVVSEEIFTEIRRILGIKFIEFLDDFKLFQKLLEPCISKVELGRIKVAISRDKDDNKIIETALAGNASFIITGDNDLLVLVKYKKLTIISPSEYLNEIL